jgi:hypothetical protein
MTELTGNNPLMKLPKKGFIILKEFHPPYTYKKPELCPF